MSKSPSPVQLAYISAFAFIGLVQFLEFFISVLTKGQPGASPLILATAIGMGSLVHHKLKKDET